MSRVWNAAAFVLMLLAADGCGGTHAMRQSTLTFTGLAGEPDSLNPLISTMSDVYSLSHLYMSFLLDCDSRGRLVPDAALEVPTQRNGGISADGRTIIYHLRRGVRWQDGKPLTAADVVFTYRAAMNPQNNVPSRVGYAEIDRISAPDAHTVVVHLQRPFSPILSYFLAPQGNIAILPAHLLAQYKDLNRAGYNEHPLGSGPFRVVEWRHGDAIVFAANPLYWRAKPRIDRIVYRIIPDPNTRMQQLRTGEVDAYFDVDPQILPQVRAIPGVRIALTPLNDVHILEFNLGDPMASDVRIREAVARAIDRTKLLRIATRGAGIAIEGDQPRGGWAFDPMLPRIAYDPQSARRLLDAAGWHTGAGGIRMKNGKPLELTLAIAPQGINGSSLVATMIQRYLHVVGILVPIKQYAPGLLWARAATGGILDGGKFQMAYNAWWVLGPDPDDSWQFACDQRPPAGLNDYRWCNVRADAAMHHALDTFDRAQRTRDYGVVQRELLHDLPEFTLWQVQMPNAYRARLHGVAPSPAGSAFWNAWNWRLSAY